VKQPLRTITFDMSRIIGSNAKSEAEYTILIEVLNQPARLLFRFEKS
jgi:hypothetical protein